MANLRTAMDASFWDLNLSTPRALDGMARAVPGEPIPLDGARASRASRMQQLSLLGNKFPLGIIPSLAPPSTEQDSLGSFSLQSHFLKFVFSGWWLGLIGQMRPKKLISSIKAEVRSGDEWELPSFKDLTKHFLDKSLYSLGVCSQLSLTSSSSVLLSTEKHGESKRRHTRAILFHKFPNHDITLEAAWPELFIDHKGNYWEVPESISLDCLSLVSESGLRYRFGIHNNNGNPQDLTSSNGKVPLALMPGLCAKAAFSYEKNKDLWRQKETKKDVIIETDEGRIWQPAYDIRLREPHAAISGIIGGNLALWFGGEKSSMTTKSRLDGDNNGLDAKGRNRMGADLFGSMCFTYQHGKFRKLYGDLTRIDARLDISSASSLAKRISTVFRNTSVGDAEDLFFSPRLNLIFQQQVRGPIVFRVDSKFSLYSSDRKRAPQLEDFIYSLNYSIRQLQSAKVVAWYSPKRKEGMIELRLFEF